MKKLIAAVLVVGIITVGALIIRATFPTITPVSGRFYIPANTTVNHREVSIEVIMDRGLGTEEVISAYNYDLTGSTYTVYAIVKGVAIQ